jgi:signal transduction histidine kinase
METVQLSSLRIAFPGHLRYAYRAVAGKGIAMLKRKTEQLTLGGFIFSVVVLLALSGVGLREAQRTVEAGEWYAHSHKVLSKLEVLRAAVTEVESLHLQYLITGDQKYLVPYRKARETINADLRDLKRLTIDNAQQQQFDHELALAIAGRLGGMEAQISAQAVPGFTVAQTPAMLSAGKQQRESVRAATERLITEEQQLLESRAANYAATKRHMQYSIAALVLVLVVTLSIIYSLVHRNMILMRRNEEMTVGINAELEARVRERTRELALRSEQLEGRTRDLESFSYSVSHDLRAPLRAISGFAQILSRRHRQGLNEEGQHFVDNIVDAGNHMGRLIDDLLSYSRLGRKAIVLKPTRLADVLAEIARTLGPRVAELGATLRIVEDLPIVEGDWTLLSQIFTNLLDNALTYGKTGMPVTVAVTWKSDADAVTISVADNGIGIAAEHFEKIFNVFQRLHSQDEYPGTGIGLAVVKKSVDLQNGRVWVDSAVGAGTVFHVQLAKAQPAAVNVTPGQQATMSVPAPA